MQIIRGHSPVMRVKKAWIENKWHQVKSGWKLDGLRFRVCLYDDGEDEYWSFEATKTGLTKAMNKLLGLEKSWYASGCVDLVRYSGDDDEFVQTLDTVFDLD